MVGIGWYIHRYASHGGYKVGIYTGMPPWVGKERESCREERPPGWVRERESCREERPPWVCERETCWV